VVVAEVAKRPGAEVPFLQPAELAADTSTDADFTAHVVEWLRDHENWLSKVVMILWPTCSFRSSSYYGRSSYYHQDYFHNHYITQGEKS
jgi:CMP-N-acetylneuraminic acid synthetase